MKAFEKKTHNPITPKPNISLSPAPLQPALTVDVEIRGIVGPPIEIIIIIIIIFKGTLKFP